MSICETSAVSDNAPERVWISDTQSVPDGRGCARAMLDWSWVSLVTMARVAFLAVPTHDRAVTDRDASCT